MKKTLKVLITRPLETAEALSRKIMNLPSKNVQYEVVVFPAVSIIDTDHGAESVQRILKEISHFDGVIFVSPLSIQKFQSLRIDLPRQIPLFCIGQDSYLKIQEAGWGKAIYPHHEYNAQALMTLPELQRVKNKRFLICQGKGGRELIHETLKDRGAVVTSLILYERCLPSQSLLPDLNLIDIVICTSANSLNNLMQLFGEPLKNKRFLLSSERLSLLGKELGLKCPFILAKHAGDEAILEALQNEMQTIAN